MEATGTDPDGAGAGDSDAEYAERIDRVERLVKRSAALISEHVDTVQIVVTLKTGENVYGSYSWGEGNWFARRDSVREWVMKQDQSTRNEAE